MDTTAPPAATGGRDGLVAWSALLVTLVVGLTLLGQGALAGPAPTDPGSWGAWAAGRDPVVATVAVLRQVALALAWYLLAATALAAAAEVQPSPTLRRVADVLATAGVRRVVRASLGAGLAVAVAAGTVSANDAPPATVLAASATGTVEESTPTDPEVPVLRRLPDEPSTPATPSSRTPPAPRVIAPATPSPALGPRGGVAPAPPGPEAPAPTASPTTRDPGRGEVTSAGDATPRPSPEAPTDGSGLDTAGAAPHGLVPPSPHGPAPSSATPAPGDAGPSDAADAPARPADVATARDTPSPPGIDVLPPAVDRGDPTGTATGPREHRVRAGDHLWGMAAARLAEDGHAPTDAEVVPYWRVLVDANRDRLVDPANPDLVLPGQVLVLPEPTT